MTVILDKAWADLLGVRRERGLYRISRRQLQARLAELRATYTPPGEARPRVEPPAGPVTVVVSLPLVAEVDGPLAANGRA